jgi:formate dehydrogenase major subunit
LPYCGVGCQLTYNFKDDKLLYVTGKEGPANQNRLCVKGRFGFDYVSNPQRLTAADGAQGRRGETRDDLVDPANPWTHFRPATWDEAMERAGFGLVKDPRPRRPRALAGFGSAKGSNEGGLSVPEAGCAPASARTMSITARGCATPRRWRHCSRASARPAVTATFNECKNSDVIIVIGREPDRKPPRRRDLLQAGGQARAPS